MFKIGLKIIFTYWNNCNNAVQYNNMGMTILIKCDLTHQSIKQHYKVKPQKVVIM